MSRPGRGRRCRCRRRRWHPPIPRSRHRWWRSASGEDPSDHMRPTAERWSRIPRSAGRENPLWWSTPTRHCTRVRLPPRRLGRCRRERLGRPRRALAPRLRCGGLPLSERVRSRPSEDLEAYFSARTLECEYSFHYGSCHTSKRHRVFRNDRTKRTPPTGVHDAHHRPLHCLGTAHQSR